MTANLNDDIVTACADLTDRAGATGLDIGYLDDDPTNPRWYAHAQYQSERITVETHPTPDGAALALAQRLLSGAMCRCRQPVSLSDARPGCRWRLVGARWEPGCDVPSITVDGGRGDLSAMARAMGTPANRAERRARRKGNR
jgi:hypothetical protein